MQDAPAFATTLDNYRLKINQAMADYFNSDQPKLGLNLDKKETNALDKLKEFSLRPGKRIRGSLALFAYDEFADKPKDSAIKLALSLELIQNYLLIIDDVMDRSSYRRGLPAMHKIFDQEGTVGSHIAEMMAIDVGMLAQHIASSLIVSIDEDPENLRRLNLAFHKNIAATAYGQYDDLLNTKLGKLNEAELIRLYELKASYYTFINPLQTGALLAGRHETNLMEHIEKIGLPAGVAFQLQDDILGVFGAEKQTGKSNLDDLREGKITLLMLYTLERASKDQQDKLKAALGNKTLTITEHKEAQSIIEECGARVQVETKAKSFAEQAAKEVASSKFFSGAAQDFLISMIKYSTNRTA